MHRNGAICCLRKRIVLKLGSTSHFPLFSCILLDEYDTPMQEAYINGFWDELVGFIRNIFNSTFKTNQYLYRGLMTGITRISKESIFSDLNNIRVITTSSNAYADKFGFSDKEVSRALKEYGLNNENDVKKWYDGFRFGDLSDIYNPWSILSYLQEKRRDTYWANTSSNGLVSKLIREGDKDHGFVLGLLVEMANDYCVKSNRESGFGRYDVVIEPYDKSKNAFILEFKVRDPEEEKSLEETAESAKRQIEDKEYKAELINNGVSEERIFSYGFAFEGKKFLYCRAMMCEKGRLII